MTKKVYYDDKSEMTVCFTDDNTFVFEITDSKEPDSIFFQNVELTTEDVKDLINDLEYYLQSIQSKAWVDNKTIPFQSAPSGIQFHNKEHYEAYLQDQSKKELSKEMQKSIEEAFGDKYTVTKEGKAIKKEKYDFLPSVTELEELKKQSNGKRK